MLMVDFVEKTLKEQDSVLIDHGIVRSNFKIPQTVITWDMIEQLYEIYNTSVPDKNLPALCIAKPESELKMSEIIFGEKRSKAQEDFERTLLFGILNGSLYYPDHTKWFWQSSKYKNLIIPRWVFETCGKSIHHIQKTGDENELWDRNLVARRLRQILNTDPDANIPWNFDLKTCFLTIKEEKEEKAKTQYFSDDIITELCRVYMTHLPKKYNKDKSKIGQYVTQLKKAKTPYKKVKAIDSIIANCPIYAYEYQNKKWSIAYENFVNYKTIAFISEFISNTTVPDFSKNTNAYVEQYVLLNKDTICAYTKNH